MARVTADDVLAILDPEDFELDENGDPVFPFESTIRPANILVTEVCGFTGSGYTAAHLKEIETWLAAHFLRIPFPQLVREEVSTLREVYQQEVKTGFDQTRYGQMAKLIDFKGYLAAMENAQQKVTAILPAGKKIARATQVGHCEG